MHTTPWNKGMTWEQQGITGGKLAPRIAHLNKIAPLGGKASTHNAKAVVQLTPDRHFVASYLSAHDAARILHITYQNICSVCNGKRQFCGGYRWEWDNYEQ